MKTNSTPWSVKLAVYAAISIWFLFALCMGISGQYATGSGGPPLLLGLTLGLPMFLFVGAYLRRGAFWAFAQTLDLKLLVLLNVWRIEGFVFLVHYAHGELPGGFAFPAGIGDMLTAVMAIPLALAMSRRAPGLGRRFVFWNIFGLLDLVVAVSSGILHSPSSFGVLAHGGRDTLLMSQFPLSLIPTFLVPMFMLTHLLALSRAKEVMGFATTADQGAARR